MLLQKSVVPRVSTNWKALGLNLGIQDSCLSAIEKSKPHQPDACCTEMFSMWLGLAPHTGGLPLTWSSVLSAVGKVDSATSEELLVELQSRTEAHLVRLSSVRCSVATVLSTPYTPLTVCNCCIYGVSIPYRPSSSLQVSWRPTTTDWNQLLEMDSLQNQSLWSWLWWNGGRRKV